MDEYRALLCLSYFSQSNDYSISELAAILGLSKEETCELVMRQLNLGNLAIEDNLIQITSEGIRFLQCSHLSQYPFCEFASLSDLLSIPEAWPLDRIYLPPKKFCNLIR